MDRELGTVEAKTPAERQIPHCPDMVNRVQGELRKKAVPGVSFR